MTLRRVLVAAAGSLGLAATANALLARRAGPLVPPLPGEHRSYRWHGMDVAYTEAGDPDAPDVLLLHGVNAAATSREFAPVFGALAEEYHVVAPDLPGFGRSDRPPITYDGAFYVDFVADFAADVLPGAACVASSLSGAYAALAGREGAPLSGFVLICPTATTVPTRRPWVRTLLRTPVVGTALFNALASEYSIRRFAVDHAYYDPASLADDEADYWWRTAHQPGARFAPASFVSGHLDPDANLAEALAALDAPVTLVWGRDADITPLGYGRDLAEAADARLVVFDNARLLPHAEHAEEFRELVSGEL